MIQSQRTKGRTKGIAVALMHGVQQRLSNELDGILGDVVLAVMEVEIPTGYQDQTARRRQVTAAARKDEDLFARSLAGIHRRRR